MEIVLIYLLKAAIAIAAFQLVYLLLFQKRKHFLFNRIYLLASMLISFLIPLISFQIEVQQTALNGPQIFTPSSNQSIQIISLANETVDWQTALIAVFILGATGFFIHLLIGHLKAISIVRQTRKGQAEGITYRISDKDIHPFSFFNQIVIPTSIIDTPHFQLVLKHEYIHIKERHTIDVFISEFLFLFQWFNPFAWLLKDAIKNNLEYLTDDQVIQQANRQQYQMAMVALADKDGIAPFLTALNGSQLKNRIIMMKSKTKYKAQLIRKFTVIPLITLLIVTLSNREFRAAPLADTNKTTIVGQVTNSDSDEPIASVSVLIKGKQIGTITDQNGNFELALPDPNATLIFSYPNYEKQEIEVTNQKKLIVQLTKSPNAFREKPSIAAKESPVQSADYEISGKVTDQQTGESIPSASVLIKNKPIGTITDTNGNYILQMRNDDQMVLFSNSGYETQEIDIKNQPKINVQLKKSKKAVNPTIQKKKVETSSTEKVKTKDKKIDGKPLFIVDGIEVKSIDNIPSDNIESITVIKDASAEILYSKKGKDGVILVTTKKLKSAGMFKDLKTTGYASNMSKSPLIIVNGQKKGKVPIESLNLDSMKIQKIDVLKDNSSFLKYGQEGIDGVILISTKKYD